MRRLMSLAKPDQLAARAQATTSRFDKDKFIKLQNQLKTHLLEEDLCDFEGSSLEGLKRVGGVDISFHDWVPEGVPEPAVAALVVLEFPGLKKVLYQDICTVELAVPYVPGFVAFREVPAYNLLMSRLRSSKPDLMPQVVLVDGNGVLHTRGFGSASQFGVEADLCTIGVGKDLMHVDGLHIDQVKAETARRQPAAKEWFPLTGSSGRVCGGALRASAKSHNPIFVSVGHRLSLDTAMGVTAACCLHRVPEPIRLADLISRDFVRAHPLPPPGIPPPEVASNAAAEAQRRELTTPHVDNVQVDWRALARHTNPQPKDVETDHRRDLR